MSMTLLLLAILLIRGAARAARLWRDPVPKSLILLVPDGCGPGVSTMARNYLAATTGQVGITLEVDALLMGTVATRSASSLVTDSAGAATAYATGFKTDNKAIAMDTEGLPLGTVFEAAKARGMKIGAIVTSRVTHATPASFSAHVVDRNKEDDIAKQQSLDQNLDFLLGGGLEKFDKGNRSDGLDLLQSLRQRGYNVFTDRLGFDQFVNTTQPFPVFGIMGVDHMDYEIDRNTTGRQQPSLSQMVNAVLQHLESNDDITGHGGSGFLMLVEASRIDHAGHSNDAVAMLHEALEWDRTVGALKQHAARFPETAVVVVADHSTGGMAMGTMNEYAWYPLNLSIVNASGKRVVELMAASPDNWEEVLFRATRLQLSESDRAEWAGYVSINSNQTNPASGNASTWLQNKVTALVSARARVGWTTIGHDAVDVNLYGTEQAYSALQGHHDNTDVSRFIQDYLELDLLPITQQLRLSHKYDKSSNTITSDKYH
eukprot:g17305.t1